MTLVGLVSLWLIHPEYRGALLVHDLVYPHVSKYFTLVNEKAGKIFAIVGIPNRAAGDENQKSQ